MPRTRRNPLADAHATIRELRNEIGSAAQPLREKIRQLEAAAVQLEAEKSRLVTRMSILERENRIQRDALDALVSLHHWTISSGNGR